MNEQAIRKYVKRILVEQEKKKAAKVKPGEVGLSVGRGGFTKVVADAGALAKKDPKQLMKNLEVRGGGKDLQGAADIIKQAIDGAPAMREAYGGMSKVTKGNLTGFEVAMGVLDARNGAKFLHHTLMGAMAAGNYSSSVPIQIQVDGDKVVVYSSEIKGSW